MKKVLPTIIIGLLCFSMFPIFNFVQAAGFPVHIICESISLGTQGSVTIAGTTYTNGQTGYYTPGQTYSITGNPPSPTPDSWYFGWWVVLYVGSPASYVDNVYSQTTNLHLNSEVYLTAEFYTPLGTNNPTSPITWGTRERITGTAGQCDNGESLTVSYYPHGSGMGPRSQNGQPPFGPLPGGGGYLWTTVTVASASWDTGLIYPTLPISLNQQLPQTYDVYAIWGSGSMSERDSNVVSFTLNPATPQIAAPTLTPSNISLGQSVTITDEIFSAAFVNSNDLTGTLTVQAMKHGTSSWVSVASVQFTSSYGYSARYGQYGDYYDLSTSWTPTEAASYYVRVIYGGNHYFVPINSASSPLTVGQPTYDVALYAHCNTESIDVSVAIAEDSSPTGFNTPHTFTGLTGTHTFTVPNTDSSGHQFKQWNTGETTTTITVTGGGTYTAYYEQPPPTYQFTVIGHCNTESSDISVNVVLDDSPPGYPTPYTFTSTIATHKFTVPSTDSSGHPFKQWSTGEASTSITVTAAGTYTAYYEQPPPIYQFTIQAYCNTEGASVGVSILMDDSPTGYNTPHTFTSLVTTHKFTVPNTDLNDHPFKQWSTGDATTSITVTSGTYTAYYEVPPNHAPSTPSPPEWDPSTPEEILHVGWESIFRSSATDQDGDQVKLVFDWGDGTKTTSDLQISGAIIQARHSWSRTGMFEVKAKAVDSKEAESGFSSSLEVTVVTDDRHDIWAGYIVRSPNQPIASVDGRFYVPAFGTQKYSIDGVWVGIGGFGKSVPLLQIGVQAITNPGNGKTDYCAFLERDPERLDHYLFRDNPSTSGCWIFAGDAMEASVSQLSSTYWTAQISDLTRGWTLTWSSISWPTADQTTAEWIFEPGAGGSSMPSSFGTITFGSATVGIGGSVYDMGRIGQILNAELYDITVPKTGPAVTSLSLIQNYRNFDIYDTGNRPASQLLVPITSLSLHSSADLHVYDSSGNHLGYNSTTGFIDYQIPDSFYFEEDGVQYVFLFGADAYNVSVVGSQDGEYHLHTQIISDETATLDQWTNDTITVNETKTYCLFHQISVESISSKTVIGHEMCSPVTLKVTNSGNYTEDFNVTLYADDIIVGTQLVTLTNADSNDVFFIWNTTGFQCGDYVLSACAEPVLGETDIEDNNLTRGVVFVGILGDINGDGTANILDAIALSNHFLEIPSSPSWNEGGANADINCDDVVNILDAIILADYFLQHNP